MCYFVFKYSPHTNIYEFCFRSCQLEAQFTIAHFFKEINKNVFSCLRTQSAYNIIWDARIKNTNVSAANRQRVLIGWRKFKWKRHKAVNVGLKTGKGVSWRPDATRHGKDSLLDTRDDDVNSRKLRASILGWGPKRSLTPRHESVRTGSARNHELELQ